MHKYLTAKEFLRASSGALVLDVRSPAEFEQGHIPGAVSFPLFSNEERAEVGTLYKQKGKTEALLKGLELIGPKLKGFVESALQLSPDKTVYLHCWRGGMRSASMATLLQTAGLNCTLLKGGYKFYRRFILSEFEKKWKFIVLGGKTGSGKTSILKELGHLGEQVLDMEFLARHKGSSFGRIGESPQPSTEQFGNDVYSVLQKFDLKKRVWIEDESQTIGSVFIPTELYNNYRKSTLIVLDIPFEERLHHLVEVYGDYDLNEIRDAFVRIKKKLGGQHLHTALERIEQGDAAGAAAIALKYYDKAYMFGLENKDTKQVSYLSFDLYHPLNIAKELIKLP